MQRGAALWTERKDHLTTTFTVTEIALNKLDLAETNVRRTGRSSGIEELAASIAAHSLLQTGL